ncbi:unnamed protein product, partial [Coccothraustes coccothraustes]
SPWALAPNVLQQQHCLKEPLLPELRSGARAVCSPPALTQLLLSNRRPRATPWSC